MLISVSNSNPLALISPRTAPGEYPSSAIFVSMYSASLWSLPILRSGPLSRRFCWYLSSAMSGEYRSSSVRSELVCVYVPLFISRYMVLTWTPIWSAISCLPCPAFSSASNFSLSALDNCLNLRMAAPPCLFLLLSVLKL